METVPNSITKTEMIPGETIYRELFQRYPFESALDMCCKLALSSVNLDINHKVETIKMISLIKDFGIVPIEYVHDRIGVPESLLIFLKPAGE